MKLNQSDTFWINCRTKEEQEKILDIFESLDARWTGGERRKPREWATFKVPMHFLLEDNKIKHGSGNITGNERHVNRGIIFEARDFHNQWISIRRANENK